MVSKAENARRTLSEAWEMIKKETSLRKRERPMEKSKLPNIDSLSNEAAPAARIHKRLTDGLAGPTHTPGLLTVSALEKPLKIFSHDDSKAAPPHARTLPRVAISLTRSAAEPRGLDSAPSP